MVVHKVRNGGETSLWMDNWHPKGTVIQRDRRGMQYDSGLREDAMVSEIIYQNE